MPGEFTCKFRSDDMETKKKRRLYIMNGFKEGRVRCCKGGQQSNSGTEDLDEGGREMEDTRGPKYRESDVVDCEGTS